ncbi:TPA: hypothetical protein ACJKCH_000127, partial [Neisseria meningitidis]
QKSGQGDEAADSTNSTARRGNAVLVFVNPLYKKTAKAVLDGGNGEAGGIRAAWKRPAQGLFASLTV